MSSRFKVVVTDYDYGDLDIERAVLEPVGAEVLGLQAKTEPELFEAAADCHAMINQYARVGRETIERMRKCKVVARYGVGVDIVDVEAASQKGILVTNVRDYCTEEVADHAIAMWLSLVRSLGAYNKATHAGEWRWQSGRPVHRIRGRKMGIVSFGKIGQAIGHRAACFGADVIVYDPYLDARTISNLGAVKVDKNELITTADYICMQAPMTPDTRHFLSATEFAQMKPGVIIVNTGRGPTIDNAALHKAMVDGIVAGAGLDDPEEEPAKRVHWFPGDNPIFGLDSVIVTPHAAYYSEESIKTARQTAASEVASVLTGQPPRFPVNAVALASRD